MDTEHGERNINDKRINMMRARSNMKLQINPGEEIKNDKYSIRTLSVYGKSKKEFDNVARPFSAIQGYNQVKFRRNN
jgi:hypothetical protein